MRPGEQLDSFTPSVTPLLATRDTTWRRFQRPFRLAIPAGMEDACAIRERGERLDPQIYARLASSDGEWLYWHIRAGETDVPTIRRFGDRDRLGRALDWARPANGNPPDLGEDEEAIVQCRAVPKLLVGETVVAIAPLETRVARCHTILDAAEKGLKSSIQPSEHILQ